MYEASHAASSLGMGIFMTYFIEWLKASPYFPWITAEKDKIVKTAHLVGAIVSAAGIHYSWNAATHTLTIPNLTGAVVALAVWKIAQQYLFQKWVYDSAVKSKNGSTVKA